MTPTAIAYENADEQQIERGTSKRHHLEDDSEEEEKVKKAKETGKPKRAKSAELPTEFVVHCGMSSM